MIESIEYKGFKIHFEVTKELRPQIQITVFFADGCRWYDKQICHFPHPECTEPDYIHEVARYDVGRQVELAQKIVDQVDSHRPWVPIDREF